MKHNIVEIESIEQVDHLFEKSFDEPIFLLKHSNSCGISSHILEMTNEVTETVNLVVIQKHRPLSDAIALKTGHRHQSPQAFVIKDGKAIYHATHYSIDPVRINELLMTGQPHRN